jgi:hypothetical protein
MNLNDLIQLCACNLQECGQILMKKNADYSHNADVHSNFKDMAELCRILHINVAKPEGCMEYEIIKKIHRLFKLINDGKPPENETLHDSFIDTQGYQTLLDGFVRKQQAE